MAHPPMRRGQQGYAENRKINKHTLGRLLKYLKPYWWAYLIIVVMLVITAWVGTEVANLWQPLIDTYIEPIVEINANGGDSSSLSSEMISFIINKAIVFVIGILANLLYGQIIAILSHKILKNIRNDVFEHMETLPIKYFDQHLYGEIMSYYTNDIDAITQMLSQVIPQMISSFLTILFVFFSMIRYSIILTLFTILIVIGTLAISKKVMKLSGKYFVAQQASVAKLDGYVEEMANGAKVVKVFTHERQVEKDFDDRNDELRKNATYANIYSNILGPLMNASGQILYVLVAFVGGLIAIVGGGAGQFNLTIQGFTPITVGLMISFLSLSKSFNRPITTIAQQMNMVILALAGADRVFGLMDEESEKDKGYVKLVNYTEDENGNIVESEKRTGKWAWKHTHTDGRLEYKPVKGHIELENVDFSYREGHQILYDINVYAEPGQKVAFVGATGAGKTTITNLINRFYDIQDGKIRYDGININKIVKSDLRKSLGVVLQDVNLFTGTVMENIRYGKLDATDEECIEAAKLANADGFIRMLPDGYNTILEGDGGGLSQGQRQLISIARAAVANPPVMILDEATSSIDTRTEKIVQDGMDALMKGRTVFVIAHRLSTVKSSDVIMVLDHGRIIERGTHEKLIEQKGTYYQLYTGAFELE